MSNYLELRQAARVASYVVVGLTLLIASVWSALVLSATVPGSKTAALVILAAIFAVLAMTTERWVHFLGAMCVLATFNAVIAAITGRLPTNRSIVVEPGEAILLASLFAVAGASCTLDYRHPHKWYQRVGVLTYVGCGLWSVSRSWSSTPLILGTCALCVPIILDRLHVASRRVSASRHLM